MRTRSTSRPALGEERSSAANAPATNQLKQAPAAAMADARTASLAQLQLQQLASNSSQAAQLKALANVMAGRAADAPTQRVEDEELLQGKFEPAQRVEDEELLQGKFEPAQRVEDEELLQGKFEPAQRVEDEELLQGKFEPAQRVEDEELLQGRFESVQRMEEEELLQGKFAAPSAQLEELSNHTGMPNQLKAGIESLSGMSMDHVKVHYNSNKPAQLNAHAYAQGSDIHMAPGQEQHLPHEAWHVVQQAQGRVRPTLQMKKGVAVNDDAGLEGEADLMGARAMAVGSTITQRKVAEVQANTHDTTGSLSGSPFLLQRKIHALPNDSAVIQYRVDPDFTAYLGAGAVTKPIMQAFYDARVLPEMTRLSNKYIEDDAKVAMKNSNTYFTMFMLNSRDDGEIMVKLNALVVAVNAAENAVGADILARRAARAVGHEADPNYVPDAATEKREERERREGAIHTVGVTKPMPLRGIQSIAEGETILANLRLDLAAALGAGYALGNVGVRGSAITGIRSRNNQPFEDGLGQHDDVDVASDLDFFFTCAPLEARIRATQQHLPADRRINAGGTMNAQYLSRWLNLAQNQIGYANAPLLLAALTAFQTRTESLIGRKSDVTFVGGITAAGLAGDAGTLIF